MKDKTKTVALGFGMTTGIMAATALPVLANTGTVDTSVISAITTITDNSIATLAGIAPVAIGIFGAIFVWKVGKKVFNIIAK